VLDKGDTEMPTYLDRYLAGEHEQVWDELMALGAAVREEPVYSDALAVARETMRRSRSNIETLIPRLDQAGYVFGLHALGLENDLPHETASYKTFSLPPARQLVEHGLQQRLTPLGGDTGRALGRLQALALGDVAHDGDHEHLGLAHR
jgi:hypothetical protein